MTSTERKIRVFRYDPAIGGEGHFDEYVLDIQHPEITTILDVLLRLQKEQDPTLSFRYACRVNMCGSCGMVINGREGLACKTNVSQLPLSEDITLRPLNHFPVIKDLMVDMSPFFQKFEDTLPFFEPAEKRTEPYVIKPSTEARMDIGMATDCIACGCCVSSCTMVNDHEDYAGPAALTRAFTLLFDERDGLFEARLTRALDSCYHCRTEVNCTEVCPKSISGTRAIKFIQRLALKHLKDLKPLEAHPAELAKKAHAVEIEAPKAAPAAPAEASAAPAACCSARPPRETFCCSRRTFIMGTVGVGTATVLAGILGVAAVAPTNAKTEKQWVPLGPVKDIPVGQITEIPLKYIRALAFHKEPVVTRVLVRRDSQSDMICFSNTCPHLGCAVSWDPATARFKCACHGGAFDKDGEVIAGPPPHGLNRMHWKVEDGLLKVEVA